MAQRVAPAHKGATPPARRAATPQIVDEARQGPRRDLIETVWVLFCSVKFAVVLNVTLAFVVMLGTIIPQLQPGVQDSTEALAQFLDGAKGRYGDLAGVMYWAGFFDIYNSLPFRMLVVFVIFGIIICTLNRWQPTMRLIGKPMLRANDAFLAGLTERAQFRAVPVSQARAEEALRSALRKGRYRVLFERSDDGSTLHLYADRDRWSKLVTFVSHAGLVMLILSAAFITQIGWRERSLMFKPGVPVNVGHGTDFSVANVGWEIEYYPDGQAIKEYRNTLAVYENDTQVLTKTIIVNDPLKYKDVNFFLVSYLPVLYVRGEDAAGATLPLNMMGASGPISETVAGGEALLDFAFTSDDNLPLDYVQFRGPEHTLTLELTYYQNVARAPNENPAAYARAFVDQQFEKPIYDAFIPRTGPLALPGYEQYRFNFRQDTATVLEVAQDPGLGVVGFFFTVMGLGFTISLYTTFTRCWARVTPAEAEGAVNIVVGGLAEKNKVAFERDFEKLALRIKDALAREA
ncbi:MAG: cytochrome c biogenesis protein ResB [Chloroflexia bacterium]